MERTGGAGQPSGAPPLQQAITLLSLRLPRGVGAGGLAPSPLLNAPAGGGMQTPALQALLQRLFGPQSGPMKVPFGQMPGAGGMPPSAGMRPSAPMLPPPPRIIPGIQAPGGVRPGQPPHFAPPPSAPPIAPPEPPPLPQNPFSDVPTGGGGFNPMPTAGGPSYTSAPIGQPIGQADPQEALQRLLWSMGGYIPPY